MLRVVIPAHNANPLGQAQYDWGFSTVSTLFSVLPLSHFCRCLNQILMGGLCIWAGTPISRGVPL